MKKFYTFLVVVLVGFVGEAQIVNIPDANFKAKLLTASATVPVASTSNLSAAYDVVTYNQIDINGDGEIQVSEAQAIRYLDVSYSSIINLTGIESFTNLQFLKCRNNQILSLNINSLTSLKYLNCMYNRLSSLNAANAINLRILACNNNLITSLNVTGLYNLEQLAVYSNLLTSVNTTGLTSLTSYDCSNTRMASLNVSGLTSLNTLFCTDCGLLNSLNIAGLLNLVTLRCNGSALTGLNASGHPNLEYLYCQENNLSYLDVSGSNNIKYLYCEGNNITGILNINNLTNINEFSCSASMTELYMKNGRFETFTLYQVYPSSSLQYVCADNSQLANIQTKVNAIGLTGCSVNSYCSFVPGGNYYTIQGINRYDSNSNGCDNADYAVTNLRFNFYDGTNNTFSISDMGSYFYDVIAGTQIITPLLENPTYFNVSPTTASVTFPAASSPFIQDFCVTSNGTHSDLEVALLPIGPARPGFDVKYKVIYKNKGTQEQSGSVNLTFNDNVLDLVSSNPIANSQAINSLTWNFSNLQPFQTREITITLNVNSPTETPAVNSGDILNYTATVTGVADETPNDNSSTLNQTVVNSFDPNDKTCIEGTTITPSMVGKYVHYVIRFENTGTANAQNIVVKDMIDTTKYDVSSLVPLSGSASYVTRITNTNQVEFIFQNINLPFDDANNDGYIAFKIKTKPTLVVGDTFSNSANIYFDYNFPIVTDTYTTTIATLGNQDFDFASVFTLSPVPAKNSLTITTKQDVVMSSVSIYNTLGQLVQVNTNPNETIDVSGLKTGTYFIKIISDKGTTGSKFVKE